MSRSAVSSGPDPYVASGTVATASHSDRPTGTIDGRVAPGSPHGTRVVFGDAAACTMQ
jgi:hypothetical protein